MAEEQLVLSTTAERADLSDPPDTADRTPAEPSFLKEGLLFRCWALLSVVLIAATWPLWFGSDSFPQIGLLPGAGDAIPQIGHRLLTVGAIVALLLIAFQPASCDSLSRTGLSVVALLLPILFLTSAHRLQPWAWQLWVFSTILVLLPRGRARSWLRWLTISIYIYSAISKFDYQFAHSTGFEFLDVLLGWSGISRQEWPVSLAPSLTLLFPLAELAIGIGLALAATRRGALLAATVLHIGLIAVFSPVGLNHHAAVMIWNAQSIVLLWWLFKSAPDRVVNPSSGSPRFGIGQLIGSAIGWIALLIPLLGPFGLCDHWLAWGLYAPSNSRAEIQIPETVTSRLPDSMRPFLKPAAVLTPGVAALDLGGWSLEETGAAVYPAAWFQTAVADKLEKQYAIEESIRVIEISRSDRFTGARTQTQVRPRDWRTK